MPGKKRKYQGHYCKICGRIRANEKFSGSGHTSHICKDCARLPREKRREMQTITRIHALPFWLKKDERTWLEAKRKDPREKVRAAAEAAYEDRFGWVEEQRRAVDELEAYLSEAPDEGDDLSDEILSGGLPADSFPPDELPFDSELPTDRLPDNGLPPDDEFLTDRFMLPTNEFPSDSKIDDTALPFK